MGCPLMAQKRTLKLSRTIPLGVDKIEARTHTRGQALR